MDLDGITALVTGGASGLGLASARRLVQHGGHIVIMDLPSSRGKDVAEELGGGTVFAPGDVTSADDVSAAVTAAEETGPLRALIHCAGIGNAVRLVDRNGAPGSLDEYTRVITVNLIGTFNVLRLAAASMASNEEVGGERGVCVLTASIAAYEGQIGQIAYSASKGGVVGMTLVAARDLARSRIRVCAPSRRASWILPCWAACVTTSWPASRRRCPTRLAWAMSTNTPILPSRSCVTATSMGRRSGWTVRSGWRPADLRPRSADRTAGGGGTVDRCRKRFLRWVM